MGDRFRCETNARGRLRRLRAGARFRARRIETRRIPLEPADPRTIATAQIRGTPRSALLEERGVSLDLVIDRLIEARTKAGGNPYRGHAQAVIVQAQAI